MLTKANFRPDQKDAMRNMLHTPKCYLMMDMRLGKTVSALTVWLHLYNKGEIGKLIVMAPPKVAELVWIEELADWEHLTGVKGITMAGLTPAVRRAEVLRPHDFIVVPYTLSKWFLEHVNPADYSMLVLDEVHKIAGNGITAKRVNKIAVKKKRVVGMSGTPVGKDMMKLYAQYRAIDGGATLGRTVTAFRAEYCQAHPRIKYKWELAPGSEDRIAAAIKPITFNYRNKHISKQRYLSDFVQLTDVQTKHYKEMKKSKITDVKGRIIEAPTPAVVYGKLAQITAGLVYSYDDFGNRHTTRFDSEKDNKLLQLIEEIDEPVLICTQFIDETARVLELVKGSVSLKDDKLANIVKRWRAGKIPALVLNPEQLQEGVTLWQGGSHVIWRTLTPSPISYKQLNGRLLHPEGERPVTVHHILADKTVDTKVVKVLEGRISLEEALRDEM